MAELSAEEQASRDFTTGVIVAICGNLASSISFQVPVHGVLNAPFLHLLIQAAMQLREPAGAGGVRVPHSGGWVGGCSVFRNLARVLLPFR